jgi:1,6-anhydro-N-acetylmuramate kinase
VVIAEHHGFTPYRGRHAALAEAFRRADLADLGQGLVCSGVPAARWRAPDTPTRPSAVALAAYTPPRRSTELVVVASRAPSALLRSVTA